jgi:hypothetical protein
VDRANTNRQPGYPRMHSTSKFEQFSNSFESEAALRLALIALIERMPNTSNIRHLHGPNELGKDIVFDLRGAFDQVDTVACVVKNEKITGSASSNSGARTVYNQAEQALSIPFPDTKGIDQRASQVFVICPFECSVNAIESIQDKLKDGRNRVGFICGPDLLGLFEKFYPEYLLFQSGLFGSYLVGLKQEFENNQPTSSILFRSGFTATPNSLSSVYVRPAFFQKFDRFTLAVSVPDHRILQAPVLEEVVIQFQQELRQLAKLVSAALSPSKEGEELEENLQRYANDLGASWKEAFEQHSRRRDLPPEEQRVPRRSLRFHVAESVLLPRGEDLLMRCHEIVADITRRVAASNRAIDNGIKDAKKALVSRSAKEITQLSTLSQQAPNALITVESEKRVDIGPNLLDLIEDDLLIVGPAGFGKSSFCRSHSLYDFTRLSDGKADIWPVYVALHQLAEVPLVSFEHTVLANNDLIELWRDSNSGVSPQKRFRVYLDGLDEIPSIRRQEEVLSLVMAAKGLASRVQFVMTSRDHVVGNHLKEFIRVRIREFDDTQITEFMTKWFGEEKPKLSEVVQQLDQTQGLRYLMRVPLLATLILSVYRNTGSLPESRVSIYEMFIRLLAGGWDSAKKINRDAQFGYSPKFTVLMRLAMILHLERRRDAVPSDIKSATKQTLPGLVGRWQRLLDELVQDGLLVPSGVRLTFPHLSFQEFLAAKDLFEPKESNATLAFERFLQGDDWWREVVIFYIALSPKPKQLEDFIQGIASRLLTRIGDRSIVSRVHLLFQEMMRAFPGSQPDFKVFNELN